MKKERLIEQSIIEYLNLLPGAFAFKVETRGVYNKNGFYQKQDGVFKGTSDIFLCYYGIFVCLEVKLPSGLHGDKKSKTYASKEQKEFICQVRKNGGVGFVVRSITDVKNVLVWIKKNKTLQNRDELKGFDINGGS
jgi:penicillin-binding protein-related factor A (putative recombinase)